MERQGPSAVVLGLSHTALGTIRSLARRGVQVTAVTGTDQGGVELKTRYARKIQDVRYLSPDFAEVLAEVRSTFDDNPVLIPTGDAAVLYVSRHRAELDGSFRFVLPEETVVDALMDKTAFARWAAESDVLVPKTVTFTTLREGLTAARDLRFPAVLKPAVKDLPWLKHPSVPKAMEIPDRESLERAYEEYSGSTERFVLQEIIPGPDRQVKFCLAYFSRSGEPLATYEGQKLRQYPPHYGSTSLAIGTSRSEVTETALSILRKANFRGSGSVEFKEDPRDGRLYVTEPTVGRPDLQSGLAAGAGVDIAYIAYCDAAGLEVPEMSVQREGHKWLFERNDLASAIAYMREGELTLRDWLRSLSGSRTWATFALDDPLPFVCLSVGLGARLLGLKTRWW